MPGMDQEREARIAEVIEHLVEPGETWTISKDAEVGLLVTRSDQSALAETHPELYGRLLQVSEQLTSAGGALCIWIPLAVLVLCVGLHLHWFAGVLGAHEDHVRSLWFYAVALIVAFFVSGGVARVWERIRYSQYREAILRALNDAQCSPHRLIADIEGDPALENLSDQMKEDPHIV